MIMRMKFPGGYRVAPHTHPRPERVTVLAGTLHIGMGATFDAAWVEPGTHVGGMVSGGVGWTDVGDTRVNRGFALRFYDEAARHYDAPLWRVNGAEPHVADGLLTTMLDGADVRLAERLVPDAACRGIAVQDVEA